MELRDGSRLQGGQESFVKMREITTFLMQIGMMKLGGRADGAGESAGCVCVTGAASSSGRRGPRCGGAGLKEKRGQVSWTRSRATRRHGHRR